MAKLVSIFGFDAKFDPEPMYDECPFYAFKSDLHGVCFKTTVNYETLMVTFDFDVDTPNGFRIFGSFLKIGHPQFDERTETVVRLFPDANYAGAINRVDLANGFKVDVELKGNATLEKVEEFAAHYN